MMKAPSVLLLLLFTSILAACSTAPPPASQEFSALKTESTTPTDLTPVLREDWAALFTTHNVIGTVAVLDTRDQENHLQIYDIERSARPYSPASTFKIPHALMALQTGVIKDEFEIIPWDGKTREIGTWNQNQTLRTSMQFSVVWVYARFAEQIGHEASAAFLKQMQYGNQTISENITEYWLDGSLRISAQEQLTFLRALYQNALPFNLDHQKLVKDIIVLETGETWRLLGKTGWDGQIGWWIGWLETPTGPIFLTLNIDTPRRLENLPARFAIAQEVFRNIGALP